MKVLHFVQNFSQPTETFIKRYVQKSSQFATTCVVAFNIINITDEIKELTVVELKDSIYTRKTIAGAARYINEYISGTKKWHYQLQDIVNDFKPDVVHCHFGMMGINWMGFEKKFNTQIPFITSFYGYDASSQPFVDSGYRRKLNELWRIGTAFFGEGPELVNKLTKLGCPSAKCMVNPLLIPVDDYPCKVNYRQPGEPLRFLFIGRFMEKKGFHVFLTAIGMLKDKLPQFSIDVIGSGPYQSNYEEIINEYGLQKNVNWLGMKPHAEIIVTLKDYDFFFVHPSLTASDNDSEGGAPTIIIEAQAAGLPVITSDHADIPYVMGYHEFLAKENNVLSLVAAIQDIINSDDVEHYVKKGLDKIQYQHNLNLSDIYESNLKKVINNN